jgi:hypothetical protein
VNNTGVRSLSFAVCLSFLFASTLPMAFGAQTKPAGTFNLFKEVSDKKGVIVWRDAPPSALPQDVCNILQVCMGSIKFIATPPATENGQRVGRALYLAEGPNKTNLVVLERQTASDVYFFLLSPDGNLQKAAYLDVAAPVRQWVSMGVSLAKPRFDQDKVVWHDYVLKLGAPAPAQQGN